MQKLITTILSNTKFADNKAASTKVYRDEPILITASQLAALTPPRYRAMRKLASVFNFASEEKIFYEQGKFMEDFEDDFDYQGQFSRYFPTYQSMDDHELRGYFSWRSKVRRGLVERTSLSFVFVYIYELLNQIGVGSAGEGFQALKSFGAIYGSIDPKIKSYLNLWLQDYIVYHNLDKSLLDDLAGDALDRAAIILLNHQLHEDEAVFQALNSLSWYDLANSRFFKQHPEDVKSVVCRVFCRLSDYYQKKNKKSICEKFFGRIQSYTYFLFKSAVFYHQKKLEDYCYEINDIYKYRCLNGQWTCERLFGYKGKPRPVGELLKSVDFSMRQAYGFKSGLKPEKITKAFQAIINGEIESFLERKRKNARPEIEIDLSKLEGIRSAALETQGKLIVEEAVEEERPEISHNKGGPENRAGLSEIEGRFIGCLLSGENFGELLREGGQMLSVLVEAVNEKFFDLFDDTVIIFDGDSPVLIEDYKDDLKRMILE